MRAVPSITAVTALLPSLLNVALFTMLPGSRTALLPLSKSQMRAVPSKAVVNTRLPSPLNAALCTAFVWPFRVALDLPLSTSQMRAVWSQDAVTTRVPSLLKAALHNAAVTLQNYELVAALGIPDARGVIHGRRQYLLAIAPEGRAIDRLRMSLE